MEVWQAIVLGLVQGLTEFLPVSSSGHLQIFNALFGLQGEENLTFAVAVHAATVCSTIVVFRQELARLIAGFFPFAVESRDHLHMQDSAFNDSGRYRWLFL